MSKDFFNSRAATWDEQGVERNMSKLEAMATRLNIKPGAVILDVGTGTGVFTPFLLKKIGLCGRLLCLDFAEEMLKITQAKGFKGNVGYLCADIEDSRLADKLFDAVVCYSAFPHFHDKPKALREIYRVLKIEGQIFICHTSSRSEINRIHCQIREVENDLIPDEVEMKQLLSNAGFADISIYDGMDDYLASARKS
jgi:ubiquinone/menaquinone biosynthesis C-methylase UbiE